MQYLDDKLKSVSDFEMTISDVIKLESNLLP